MNASFHILTVQRCVIWDTDIVASLNDPQKMTDVSEAVRSSEMSVNFHQTTGRHMSQSNNVYVVSFRSAGTDER
jgi:hypothetical protein